VEEVLNVFENLVPKGIQLHRDGVRFYNSITKERPKDPNEKLPKNKLSEAEEKALLDRMYKNSKDIFEENKKFNVYRTTFAAKFDLKGTEVAMERDMEGMFAETTDGLGQKLKDKFDEYKAIKQANIEGNGVSINDPELLVKYSKIKDEFMDIYEQVADIKMKKYMKAMYDQPEVSIKHVDFEKVCFEVIKKHIRMDSLSNMAWDATKLMWWLGKSAMKVMTNLKDVI
jgi:hypothetical protein